MASRTTHVSIKNLAEDSRQCSIIARVLRLYTILDRANNPRGIEVILMDSEAIFKILGIVRQQLAKKFKDLLKEGQICMMSNFKLAINQQTYKSARINHPLKIEFGFNTKVEEPNVALEIPRNGFNFVRFRDVSHVDSHFTLDVVGRYSNHSAIERVGPWNARKLDVTLLDNENTPLLCVLWESYADELLQFIESRGGIKDSFTIALQFVSISKFQEVCRVQTMKGPSILIMDRPSDEITTFLNTNVQDQSSLHNSTNSCQVWAEWFPPNSCKSIQEILKCAEPGVYTTIAEVVQIDDKEWFFSSCNKCSRRVQFGAKEGDTCHRCCRVIEKIIPRYKVRLEVSDNTGSAHFVLFEAQAKAIMGRSSADMLQILTEENRVGDFPDQFGEFCDKEWIFRIHVDENYNIAKHKDDFSIKQLSDDNQLLSDFKKMELMPETPSALPKSNAEDSSFKDNSEVSVLDTLEDSFSNSNNWSIPQKRSMVDTVDLYQTKTSAEQPAMKIPKKEK